MIVAQRKIKYGTKVTAISAVMRDIAEELIDLTERMESDHFDVSAQMLEQHRTGLLERVQIRADLLHKLSALL